ncbi:MAG TPA: hypothetical protein VIF62_13110 [Labilithrix sp.]|jgi:hypothetical protein
MKRFLCLSLVALAACSDPEHDTQVDALGPEPSSPGPGPTHRPGQPCLTCHGGDGPAKAQFAVAGTIFQTADRGASPLSGGNVILYDSTTDNTDDQTPHTSGTNAAGNFYFDAASWSPIFPLHDITLDYPGISPPRPKMHTRVGRDGSCATCHFDPPDPSALAAPNTPGHVYLVLEAGDLPGGGSM